MAKDVVFGMDSHPLIRHTMDSATAFEYRPNRKPSASPGRVCHGRAKDSVEDVVSVDDQAAWHQNCENELHTITRIN